MANHKFTADLIDDVLFRAGEPTDGTSDFAAAALRYINRAYKALWMGGGELVPGMNETWWWLRKTGGLSGVTTQNNPGVLTLDPAITDLTATVTNNNATVTMSAAPTPTVDADVDGWFFKVDDHADVFRVSSQSTVTLTLDSVYTGTSGAGKSCRLFKLAYTLASDVLRLAQPMRAYQDGVWQVNGMELDSLERTWPLRNVQQGVPTAFAMVQEREVRFNKYGGSADTELMRVEYDYLLVPSDLTDSATEEPLVPLAYRYILADYALGLVFSDRGDERANSIISRAAAGLKAMAKENRAAIHRMGDLRGKIIPRMDQYVRSIGPVRTDSGLIIG